MRSRHLLSAGVGVVGGAGARRGPCATRDTARPVTLFRALKVQPKATVEFDDLHPDGADYVIVIVTYRRRAPNGTQDGNA